MTANGKIQLSPMFRVAMSLVAGIVCGEMLYDAVSRQMWLGALIVSVLAALASYRRPLKGLLICISFAFLGGFLICGEREKTDIKLPESEVCYNAVITSRPVVGTETVKFDMVITGFGQPIKVKANIKRDNRAEALRDGYGISCISRLNKPENIYGVDFDYKHWLLRHGYAATTYIRRENWHVAAVSLAQFSYLERTALAALRLRDNLLERYKAMAKEDDSYAVLAAMTLGDKSSLGANLKEDYSASGASHVLALSGLHLGIIYAVLLFMFSGFRKRWLALPAVVLAVWVYVFIVGMPPSAVRSAVMLTIHSFMAMLNRDGISLNALAFAAVAMLISNPLDVYDAGFQMSFMAVLSILIFCPTLCDILPRRLYNIRAIRWLWQMCSVSVAAQIGVAPLVAFYFGRFSCYFLLTNLIAVPAATVILYGTVLLLPLSIVSPLQTLAAEGLIAVASFLNSSVSFIASLPGASIDGININLLQLSLVYVAIAAFSVFMFYLRKIR